MRGWLALGLGALVLGTSPSYSQTSDLYNYQTYDMAGRGRMLIVDFDYPSRAACMKALNDRAQVFQQQHSDWTMTRQFCSTKISGRAASMRDNQPIGWPYLTFQDMRQWIEGVDNAKALEFCQKSAGDAKFNGQARCVR